MALSGEVVDAFTLTPSMRRVVLGGEGLASFEPTPFTDGYVNVLFLPEAAPQAVPFDADAARQWPPELRPRGRRYTIRSWDPQARQLTIDFVVHGDQGYAGRWAAAASPGDLVQFTGPSGAYAPAPDADWHLLIGDESALPAIAASLEVVPEGRPVLAALLVEDERHQLELACPGDLRTTWVHRASAGPGSLLRAVEGLSFPPGRADVFLHGEASEVRSIRRHLLGARGLPKEGASISPYWRRGHDDEAWRKVKRQWLEESEQDI